MHLCQRISRKLWRKGRERFRGLHEAFISMGIFPILVSAFRRKSLLNAFFFAIIILCGCEGSIRDRNPDFGVSLEKIGEKIFPIDSLTTTIPQDIQISYLGGDTLFTLLNQLKNEIQIYDYQNQKLTKKISFDINFFGQISDFYFHNIDSIFISSLDSKRAWLIEGTSKTILKRFDFDDAFGSALPIGNENILFFNEHLLIGTQVAMINTRDIEDFPLVYIYNLNDSSRELSSVKTFLHYPEIYENSYSPELGLYYISMDYKSKDVYFGFSASDSTTKLSIGGKTSNFMVSPMNGLSIQDSENRSFDGFESRNTYYYETSNYGSLLTNSEENILIRTIYFPVENLKEERKLTQFVNKPKSLLFYSLTDSKVIGQFTIDKELYNEGLMLSVGKHTLINKRTENENQLVFDVFEFSHQ